SCPTCPSSTSAEASTIRGSQKYLSMVLDGTIKQSPKMKQPRAIVRAVACSSPPACHATGRSNSAYPRTPSLSQTDNDTRAIQQNVATKHTNTLERPLRYSAIVPTAIQSHNP